MMDESLFSAIRIVAQVISADGVVDEKRRHWFLSLAENYGASTEQREVLHMDLERPNPIENIHARITRASDRERLMTWVRAAMSLDGIIHPNEKKLYDCLLKLNEKPEATIDHRKLAEAILKEDRAKEMWAELNEAGKFLAFRPSNPFGSRWMINQMFFRLLASRNRFIIWGLVIFFILFVLVRVGLQFVFSR